MPRFFLCHCTSTEVGTSQSLLPAWCAFVLPHRLTNTVTLLHMLQKNIKPASGSSHTRRPMATTARSVFGGLFSRAGGGGLAHAEASIHGGGVGGFKQVEAKYPALLFKQQLDAFVQKIFPMMRDNVKRVITPMLANCIHTPKGHAGRPRTGMDQGEQKMTSTHPAGPLLAGTVIFTQAAPDWVSALPGYLGFMLASTLPNKCDQTSQPEHRPVFLTLAA